MIPILLIIILLHLSLTLQLKICVATITNLNVKRVTDVASSIAISKTTVTMRNDASEPASFFYVAVKKDEVQYLGDFWIVTTHDPRNALRLQLHDNVNDNVPDLDKCCVAYKAFFATPLAPAAEQTVEIRMDISNAVKPLPETIEQYQSQYMKYAGNAYFYTPYRTDSMESILILGSQQITSKQGLLEPFQLNANRLNMGPYNHIEPLSSAPISIRFKNDKALLVAKHVIKEFYVSHWGSIATKEEYVIFNAAAAHKGEWSRADHTRHNSKYATAAGDMWANLPPHATRVTYKDLVGNITSSRLRKPTKSKRAIQMTFRFPLMGGWRNHFWITYDTPLSKYAISKGSEHVLTLPIFPTANVDLLCEQLEVRVLLPEGAHAIQVVRHPSLAIEVSHASERTTLTLFGRPVLTLRMNSVRSQSKHVPNITISYRYNPLLVWITPVFVAAVILSFFVTCIVCVRSGLNVDEEERPSDSSKMKTS